MKRLVLTTLLAFATLVTGTLAQKSPSEIRAWLGGPVNIEQAALLSANIYSYRELCGADPEFYAEAELLSRIQYGSLDEGEDQDRFKQVMIKQAESNAGIFAGLDPKDHEPFCQGLNASINHTTAEFIRAHPELFPKAADAPKPEPQEPGLEEQIRSLVAPLDPALQFYVIQKVEGSIHADVEKLFADPENQNAKGELWVFKVLAREMALLSIVAEPFPEISQLYAERANIYGRMIRGEITWEQMATLEQETETAIRAAFQARVEAIRAQSSNRTVSVDEANAAIDELSQKIVGSGRIYATQ